MNAEQLINQGVAAGRQGQFAEAAARLREALSLDDRNARGHLNLAVALFELGEPDDALISARKAVELGAEALLALQTLANTLLALNRVDQAIAVFGKALQVSPNNPESHGMLAKALLLNGDFKRGWAEYEWRWRCESFADRHRTFPQPRYTGGKVADKTILLHHEQGFGDTIQFVRYIPLLAERGAEVIVQTPRELADLIRRMPTSPQVTPLGELSRMPFDLHAPIMSLPLAFGTTLKTIPANVPYLSASPKSAEVWAQRVRESGDGFRVGLAWSGRQKDLSGRSKSMSLGTLAPLAQAPGVIFHSLQKWDPTAEAANPPAGMRLINSSEKVFDFSDAAALIANLDLVITVDTAIAHLAGAMGRPVWVMLPFAADFRWLLTREDSPWYPTMRLFRQPRPGDWSPVIERVAAELRQAARVP